VQEEDLFGGWNQNFIVNFFEKAKIMLTAKSSECCRKSDSDKRMLNLASFLCYLK